jgi:hypothetical protein
MTVVSPLLVPRLPSPGSLFASPTLLTPSRLRNWCTRFDLLAYVFPIILFMCTTFYTVLILILSNEFNSTSAFATSMFPKGRHGTKPSLGDAGKPQLDSVCHHAPHSFSHMISPVVFFLRRRADQHQLTTVTLFLTCRDIPGTACYCRGLESLFSGQIQPTDWQSTLN